MRRSVQPWLALCGLALVAACLESTTPLPPEESSTGQPLTSCADNCDCFMGSFCENHVCAPDFGVSVPCYCAPRDCGAPTGTQCAPVGLGHGIGACPSP